MFIRLVLCTHNYAMRFRQGSVRVISTSKTTPRASSSARAHPASHILSCLNHHEVRCAQEETRSRLPPVKAHPLPLPARTPPPPTLLRRRPIPKLILPRKRLRRHHLQRLPALGPALDENWMHDVKAAESVHVTRGPAGEPLDQVLRSEGRGWVGGVGV